MESQSRYGLRLRTVVLVVAGAIYSAGKNRRVAMLLGTVVVSHWALDFVTHRPELP